MSDFVKIFAEEDIEQISDSVDTPAEDISFWPSIDDFQDPERTLPWRDVPLGIYKILETYDRGKGRFGPSVVLKLKRKDGETIFAWAAVSIVYAMKKRKSTTFICNLGLKVSEATDSVFYDFKLY